VKLVDDQGLGDQAVPDDVAVGFNELEALRRTEGGLDLVLGDGVSRR
jgi:hypothetical protein